MLSVVGSVPVGWEGRQEPVAPWGCAESPWVEGKVFLVHCNMLGLLDEAGLGLESRKQTASQQSCREAEGLELRTP